MINFFLKQMRRTASTILIARTVPSRVVKLPSLVIIHLRNVHKIKPSFVLIQLNNILKV